MNRVKVFSTVTCGVCVTLEKYLKQKGIEYEKVFVDKDQEAMDYMMKMSGGMTVPVTIVDNKKVILGFNPGKLQEALDAI